MERVLESDPGVLVFACSPVSNTRLKRLGYLGQLWYLPTTKTILIDWNSSTRKLLKLCQNDVKFCSHGKFDVVVDTYAKLLCLWITSIVVQMFSDSLRVSDSFRWIHPQPFIAIYLIPDAWPEFAFTYMFHRYLLHAWALFGRPTIQIWTPNSGKVFQ